MKNTQRFLSIGITIALFSLVGCAPLPGSATGPKANNAGLQKASPATAVDSTPAEEMQLPVRYQTPSYMLEKPAQTGGVAKTDDLIVPVGADISSTNGPVTLRDILKRLTTLKNMNVSWASDVDPSALVDVDIRAEDDFFNAIDNLLRQKDYFHELQGNTIVIKYKETRRFHIAMPNLTSTYTTSVGGDVLGGSGTGSNVTGNIQISSTGSDFNIWDSITENIEKVLDIWQEPAAATTAAPATGAAAAAPAATAAAAPVAATTTGTTKTGQGHYSFDKQIGLITVTAPRPLLEKIADYLDNLKKELYRQVTIEAKILEVTLDDTSTKGIDWSGMLSGKDVDFQLFGPNGIIYSTNPDNVGSVLTQVSLTNPFSLALDFLDTQGDTKVLANPKISVMNGQPAMISVGDNVKYIDSVTTTLTDGVASYAVTTGSVMSGLGMAVVATIMDNDEIVLNLTPVTSKLQEPIEYKTFGGANTVGLPKVRLREMKTTVKIKNGQILVIGGLIDSLDDIDGNKVPFLGDVPGLGGLFSHKTKTTQKTELVILLQPKIL
ncbi:MAG: pilus (MSHA type) biogenesis protein MshL [Desulfobulbaceae bacterium]|nr:pilus (MSHA type) biogenesis protein MshL [Desulfobulbaceae bacterium]